MRFRPLRGTAPLAQGSAATAPLARHDRPLRGMLDTRERRPLGVGGPPTRPAQVVGTLANCRFHANRPGFRGFLLLILPVVGMIAYCKRHTNHIPLINKNILHVMNDNNKKYSSHSIDK